MTAPMDPHPDSPSPASRRVDPDAPTVPRGEVVAPGRVEGTAFGPFRLIAELGHGGMGVVWKAWDPRLGRLVAVKGLLSPWTAGEEQLERFQREAKAAARLRHPNIVAVHEVGVHEGQPFLVSDYIEGQSLEARLSGGLPMRQAVGIVSTVALALQYAHDQGIIHRDVKPSNILLDSAGHPWVADFGLAKDVRPAEETALTVTGDLLGTPAYMSPEQARGDAKSVGPASDQYSLGVVLYETLARRRPFTGTTVHDVLNAVISVEPASPGRWNADVPKDLDVVCLKAMEKDPAQRYGRIDEFAADLGRWLAGEPILARPVSLPRRWARRVARRPRVAAAVALAAVVLAGVGGWGISVSLKREQEGEARARQEAARAQAIRLLEEARPALDRAVRCLYDRDAQVADLQAKAEEASKLVERAIEIAPSLPLGHYLLGRVREMQGREDLAESAWRDALQRDPAFGLAHFQLGRLLLARSRLLMITLGPSDAEGRKADAKRLGEEAVHHLDAALQASALGGTDEGRLARELAGAMAAFADRNTAAVREACSGIASRFRGVDGVEEAWCLLGCAEKGAPQREAFEEALRIRPKYPLALFYHGLVRFLGHDPKGALEDLSAALELSPRAVHCLVQRGMARKALRDFSGSVADFSEAVRLEPGRAQLYNCRGVARKDAKDFEGAIADFDEVLRREPGCVEALSNRGAARMENGDHAGAMADFDAAIKLKPAAAGAYANRGAARHWMGDFDGAMADYDRALELEPRMVLALTHRAFAWCQRAEYDKAIADCNAALDVWPESFEAYRLRGLANLGKGERERAAEDLTRALEYSPSDWPYRSEVEGSLQSTRTGGDRR